jgi:hypothetical protein
VWEFVCSLLEDPERLRLGVERLVEREERLLKTGAAEEEAKTWEQRLEGGERKRSNLQDMAAEGLITFAELGIKLTRDRLEASKQGTQNLVDSYTEMVPEALEVLPSETRHRIYKILNLTITTRPDGTLLANMVLVEDPKSCTRELASSYPRTPCLPLATGYRSAFARSCGSEQQSSRHSREGTASVLS